MASRLPDDLFAPRDSVAHEERKLELPGGGAGTIAVSFTALTDPATGLMRQARREIVAAIADVRQLTREEWTLTSPDLTVLFYLSANPRKSLT